MTNLPNAKPLLIVENLKVEYEDGTIAVHGLSFDVHEGEFICIVGPTGCGKTTILNSIAGFFLPSEGTVRLEGEIVRLPGRDRGIVFQSYALLPWETALGNVEFGLKLSGVSSRMRRMIAMDLLESVGLADRSTAYPHQLSGGMQQRVAIARCLANKPKILLMDEPFGSLDSQTRSMMHQLILKIWKHHMISIVFVTHDVDEAIYLSDRLLALTARPASIKQEFQVFLPRPRIPSITLSDGFIALKKLVLAAIADEVRIDYSSIEP